MWDRSSIKFRNCFRGAKACTTIAKVKSGIQLRIACHDNYEWFAIRNGQGKVRKTPSSDQCDLRNWRKCQSKQQQGIIITEDAMEKPACGTKKRNGKTRENSWKKMGRNHTHNTFGFKIVFLKINLIRLRNSNDFNLPHFDHAPWRPEFRLRTETTFTRSLVYKRHREMETSAIS